ncbi:Hypothetical Protein FCC1311_080232 [Hondaea fermentalgiana]|uniref:Uncharacterized protein n=1 Tax=Hondaea fermentalgiana TaxID=2315210 RepID=A0A2R5GPU5_9STRA|nr:Hypothetical Protein FCC1311_080232 [Hondaea fermentalgiana]|eukprot:GBG31798.1 Hypothetical Protein FCC1311_080232 [Hondaea fermentalgiana]
MVDVHVREIDLSERLWMVARFEIAVQTGTPLETLTVRASVQHRGQPVAVIETSLNVIAGTGGESATLQKGWCGPHRAFANLDIARCEHGLDGDTKESRPLRLAVAVEDGTMRYDTCASFTLAIFLAGEKIADATQSTPHSMHELFTSAHLLGNLPVHWACAQPPSTPALPQLNVAILDNPYLHSADLQDASFVESNEEVLANSAELDAASYKLDP